VTVDLIRKDKILCTIDMTMRVEYGSAHAGMTEGSVYEMTVCYDQDRKLTTFVNPVKRLAKKNSKSPEIIRKAIMAAKTTSKESTILYDITAMSMQMGQMIYKSAKAQASSSRKVIVSAGTGRLWELREMEMEKFSYILIDPEVHLVRR
jgi:hypothetical protein